MMIKYKKAKSGKPYQNINNDFLRGENSMNENTKLEIAVEIMAFKIAKYSEKCDDQKDKTLLKLIDERTEMYKGNKLIIDKIINEYGLEIKSCYENM